MHRGVLAIYVVAERGTTSLRRRGGDLQPVSIRYELLSLVVVVFKFQQEAHLVAFADHDGFTVESTGTANQDLVLSSSLHSTRFNRLFSGSSCDFLG